MKKTIVIGFISFVLSFSSMGMAASVGNIVNTQGGGGKFSLSIEYDRLDNRDMKLEGKGSQTTTVGSTTTSGDAINPGDSVKDFKSSANMLFLKGTIGIHPNIDLFLKVGAADANFKYKYVSPGSPDQKNEFFNDDYGFASGVGLKARLFETSGGLRFMADAQYLYYEVEGEYKVAGKDLAQFYREGLIAAGASSVTASYESKTKVQEWHAALYVNQTFAVFSPYAGVKYSDLLIENNTSVKGRLRLAGTTSNWSDVIKYKAKADKNLGIFLGADIYVIPNQLSVNLEGRLLDETAATIGVTYKY